MSMPYLAYANGVTKRSAPLELIGSSLKFAHRSNNASRFSTPSGHQVAPPVAGLHALVPGGGMSGEPARARFSKMAATDFPLLLDATSMPEARATALQIHQASPRAGHPFAEVNCAALSEEALELELFGYDVRTDFETRQIRTGVLERCHGGTVLLAEITALPSRLQARLLDLLDDRRLSRLGGDSWVEADTRLLFASPMDAEMAMAAGMIRSDLYYRLHKLAAPSPTPWGRGNDLPELVLGAVGGQ
jgi:transcriptional regulator with PAS, ATPase and Fis domain